MHKGIMIGGAFGAVAIIGFITYSSMSSQQRQNDLQRENDEKLAKLQRQIDQQKNSPPNTVSVPGTWTGNSATVDKQRAIHDALTEGARLLATKKPADAATAAKIYQEALEKLDPDNLSFHLGLGYANLQRNEPAEAAHTFLQAIAKSKNHPEFWVGLGQSYWDLKDYFHAKSAYEQAIMLDPKSVPAWTVMAWVYLGLKDQIKATKGFQVLNDSGGDRIDWKNGLSMARSSNFQLDQIRSQFPLPDPEMFLTPPPTRPATTSAAKSVATSPQ